MLLIRAFVCKMAMKKPWRQCWGMPPKGLCLTVSMGLKNILALIQDAGDSHSILIPQARLKMIKYPPRKRCPDVIRSWIFVQSAAEYQSILAILFADTYL